MRKIKSVMFFIVIILIAMSCSGDSVSNNGPLEVIAEINAPSTVTVGTEVTLDGSDSTGPIVAYGWLMISQPQNSPASINNSEGKQASFTPDVEGEYVIRLNAISDESLADSEDVTITANASN